jgi:hypothetical protein
MVTDLAGINHDFQIGHQANVVFRRLQRPQTGIALCRRTDGQARFPLKEGIMTDKIIIYGKAG